MDEGERRDVAIAALVPDSVRLACRFWSLLYVCRAQVIGFRAVVPWATLGWPKKAFVAFCALASLAVILFGITVVMNLYVDTQVPVALSPFLDVIKTGGDWVDVGGTWTRSGSTEGSSIVHILCRPSKIACNRIERRCTEARAFVAGNVLMSELVGV